jgi:hypothetical protein
MGIILGTTVTADAKFLHRVFLALVFFTTIAGAMVGLTTVQAMNAQPNSCVFFCTK